MITVLIFIIIGIILAIIIGLINEDDGGYIFLNSVLYGLIGMCVWFMVAFIIPAKTIKMKEVYVIECLQDNSSTQGSFFLGTGQVDGVFKYAFYYKYEDGFQMKLVNYNDAIVKYSDEKPRVERYFNKPKENELINLFTLDHPDYSKYYIYVPKGSIKQNYTLDAQ